MAKKAKKAIGWSMIIGLFLGLTLGLPYGAEHFGWFYILDPWYVASLNILKILGIVLLIIGFALLAINLIESKEKK